MHAVPGVEPQCIFDPGQGQCGPGQLVFYLLVKQQFGQFVVGNDVSRAEPSLMLLSGVIEKVSRSDYKLVVRRYLKSRIARVSSVWFGASSTARRSQC